MRRCGLVGCSARLAPGGAHVALLISRHGGVIYRRYTDRHRMDAADAAAAENYLNAQAPIETAWSRALGLEAAELDKETALIAFADTLSLALCGEMKAPLDLEAPGRGGEALTIELAERPQRSFDFVLSPWPFRVNELMVEGEARPLPAEGRFSDEDAMKTWLASPERVVFRARLAAAVGCDRPRRYSAPRGPRSLPTAHAGFRAPRPRSSSGWIVQPPCAPLSAHGPRRGLHARRGRCYAPRLRPFSSKHETEGWPSGRRRTPGKCVYGKPYRGFESRPLRHPGSGRLNKTKPFQALSR